MFGWIVSRGAALSASLVLHCILLFFGYYLQKNNVISPLIPEAKELMQKRDFEWAATEAAPSQFGAPIEFQSISELVKTGTPQENPDEKTEPFDVENIKKMTIQENPVEDQKELSKSDENSSVFPETQKTNITKHTTVEKSTPPQTVQSKQQLQNKPLIKKETPAIKTPQQKKPFTLSQLANGFLDHVKTNGTDSSTMLGKKEAMPTDEQLKHQRYAEKISWCLQQSFKQNHARLADYHQAVVEVYLALNKNGSINQVSIAKSSGKPRVDQFVLFTFQDAQSSFPPVPEYFHEDPYKIVYIIHVETLMR